MSTMPSLSGPIGPTDDVAGLPKKARQDADKIAKYVYDNYREGLHVRRPFAREWIKIHSIMRGIHYFRIDADRWVPLVRIPGKLRAIYPIMQPMYELQLGRLSSNKLGVVTMAKPGRDVDGFYQANTARAIMTDWIEQAEIEAFDDVWNQHLLYYGMSGTLRYYDWLNRQVMLESIPGCELFPIPFDAKRYEKCDGIMRVARMTEQWLEQQDDQFERAYGAKPSRRMAAETGSEQSWMSTGSIGFETASQWGRHVSGATVIWFWIKPTEVQPLGQVGLLINDKLYRIQNDMHPQTGLPPMPGNRIPIEVTYYTKLPDSFYGKGFLESQTAPQREANRQYTEIVKRARQSGDKIAYKTPSIDPKDMNSRELSFIPFQSVGYEDRVPPLIHVPGTKVTKEIGAVLEMAVQASEKAGNMTSKIIFGQQEGRTEGGPATSLLDTRANQPLDPVMSRKFRALTITYRHVIDMLRTIWPAERAIPAIGKENLGREIMVQKGKVPQSRDIIMYPTPITPGGRHMMLNMVMQLRQMPGPDNGFELSSREFRRALQELGMAPPGIDTVNKAEQRIFWRVEQLIGDTKRPYMEAASNGDPTREFEDAAVAFDILRETVLDPGFRSYGPEVQKALMDELNYYKEMLNPKHPDLFEDDLDKIDMRQLENFLDAEEQDPNTPAGQFMVSGQMIGT